jgi:hypothetical protein
MSDSENAMNKHCFVIAPIGGDGSPERQRSNLVLRHIITPVAVECGYTEPIFRADQISRPGLITNQIIGHLLNDDLVVADLTGKNPNVFYELAIRHATRKPMVQLIQAGEDIPFDVAETRTIQVDHRDLDSVAACKVELKKQIVAVEKDPNLVDTPLSVVVDLQSSRGDQNPVEKILLQLMDRVNELSYRMRHFERDRLLVERDRLLDADLATLARERGLRLARRREESRRRDEAAEQRVANAVAAADEEKR